MPVLADSPGERHVPNDAVSLRGGGGVIVEGLPLHDSRRVLEQLPDGDAIEVRSSKISQILIDRRINIDLSLIDEQHDGHRRGHDFRHRCQIKHGRDPHASRCRQPPSLVVIELRVPKRPLMNDPSILRDQKNRPRK